MASLPPRPVIIACVGLISACASPQHATSSPGTNPAVWKGAPAPPGAEAAQPGAQGVAARLTSPDGTEVATARFDFGNGYATITIATSGPGRLAPGFHGVHIHKVGKCEPNSVAPVGGAPGDFLSAGELVAAPRRGGETAAGDLTLLQVREDGSGMLVTTTDAFAMQDLVTGEKTAIIINAGAENPANIPAAGDAGKRLACGVIGAG
ncbi:MAG: superoxide dismutase family protein [Mycobacterium sp.]